MTITNFTGAVKAGDLLIRLGVAELVYSPQIVVTVRIYMSPPRQGARSSTLALL